MSVRGLPTLNKFRYQERSSTKFKSETDCQSPPRSTGKPCQTSMSNRDTASSYALLSSPSFHSQDSDVTCIPETPTSLVCSPRSPLAKTKRLNNRRSHDRLAADLCSSDSDDCRTPRTSNADKRERKPLMRSLGERKFRLVSTGSESSDSEDDDHASVNSVDTRSSSALFDASSSCNHNDQHKPAGTSTQAASIHSFKFNKKLNLSSTSRGSSLQYTALPSSSESDTDVTTLGSCHDRDALNPAGLSDLDTPPPTVGRKKRRRILSEGQESNDGGNKDEEDEMDVGRKNLVMKLQEMFPKWTSERLREVLASADWCVGEAASIIASKDSNGEHSDDGVSSKAKKIRKKKRRKIEHVFDKENGQQWLSKLKLTAYFPKVTRPNHRSNEVKQRPPDHVVPSSEDEASSSGNDSSDDGGKSDELNGEEDADQAEVNQLIVNFLNDAAPEELLSINHCSKTKVKKIEDLRPYEDYDDLISKFESTKGLSTSLVWNCSEVFQRQQVMTTVMNKCAKIADNIQTIITKLLPDQEGEDSSQRIEDGQVTRQPALLSDKFLLKPYQMVGLNWLALMHRQGLNGILADEMGLGKTVQTIAFLAHLLEQGDGGPHLIVVPSSTLGNWVREFHTWCPSLEVILYTGSLVERRELKENILAKYLTFNVIISSYNMCISNVDDRHLFRKMGIHYAVFDEAHMLKNMRSQRYKHLMKIRAERKLLLTGTPLQNNLKELISLLSFLMPDMFCDKAEELQKMFCLTKQKSENPYEQSTFERERITHAKQIMQPFILRRLKSEVLKQLPKKMENIVKCPMISSQEECYNNIKTTLSRDLRNLGGGAKTSLSCAMMQLRKAANHEVLMRNHYDDNKLRQMAKLMLKEPTHYDAESDLIFEDMSVMSDYELHRLCHEYNILKPFRLPADVIIASGKFQVLDKMLPELKQRGDRVLMFSQFVIVLDIIETYMKHHQYRYLRLDGQTQVCDRLALIDKYNSDEDIFVFLLSTRAGGLGINLTSANHVILHDIDYNPYNDKQAEDRCHRVGQERDVTITKLISSNSIEEGMLGCAQYKLQLEEQMTTNDGTDGDAKNAADTARLLRDALDL